jgi:hypothetical protein
MSVAHGPELAPALLDTYLILQDFRQDPEICSRLAGGFRSAGAFC